MIAFQSKYLVGFATLRELITKCPAKQHVWLQLLLELSTREKEQVIGRQTKINSCSLEPLEICLKFPLRRCHNSALQI